MYAVIKTGGKQYRVAAEDIIKIEKVDGNAGDAVAFDNVLMVGEGDDVTIGAPLVDGAMVAGEILGQDRNRKIIIFKKRRRKHYRRRNGHRQHVTLVKITEILTAGKKPSAKKTAKATPAKDTKAPAKKAAPAKSDIKDDVELIGGVGPALGKKLNAAGVTTLTQVSKWTAKDIEKINDELSLGGRIEREEWVEQAKELLAGKPPRAKVDQAAAKKK